MCEYCGCTLLAAATPAQSSESAASSAEATVAEEARRELISSLSSSNAIGRGKLVPCSTREGHRQPNNPFSERVTDNPTIHSVRGSQTTQQSIQREGGSPPRHQTTDDSSSQGRSWRSVVRLRTQSHRRGTVTACACGVRSLAAAYHDADCIEVCGARSDDLLLPRQRVGHLTGRVHEELVRAAHVLQPLLTVDMDTAVLGKG
jgi:hypothetical protein